MSPVTIATLTGGRGLSIFADQPTPSALQPPGATPRAGPGECVLATKRPSIVLRCKLGKTSAKLGGGVGGWVTVDRPGRSAGLEWVSLPSRTLTIALLFDGFTDRRSVDADVNALYVMGRPPSGSPRGTPPPVIRVGGMVPHGDRDWVLTDIADDDTTWDGEHRIRAWRTVTLTEFDELELVKITAKKTGGAPSTRTHVVRAGESLGTIARDQMGAKTSSAITKAVAELKKLNGIRDAKSVKVGQKIKVPRA